MESGPSRVNAPLGGPVIPRSRRNLFKDQSFVESDNAGIKAGKAHASGAQHAKEKVVGLAVEALSPGLWTLEDSLSSRSR